MENSKKEQAKGKKRPNHYVAPVKIQGEFLDVFKVVKKNKEEKKAKKSSQ